MSFPAEGTGAELWQPRALPALPAAMKGPLFTDILSSPIPQENVFPKVWGEEEGNVSFPV